MVVSQGLVAVKVLKCAFYTTHSSSLTEQAVCSTRGLVWTVIYISTAAQMTEMKAVTHSAKHTQTVSLQLVCVCVCVCTVFSYWRK